MKKRRTIFITILLFTFQIVRSQNCEIINPYIDKLYSKEEIKKLEQRICFQLEEKNAIPDDNRIKLHYIPSYSLKKEKNEKLPLIRRKDFLDHSFINNLTAEYVNVEEDKYIRADVLMTNSCDIPIGLARAQAIYLLHRKPYDGYYFILEKKQELELKYLFTISNFFYIGPIFGISEDDSICVLLPYDGRKVLSIEEFVEFYSTEEYEGAFDE